jgi:hypothetical protein
MATPQNFTSAVITSTIKSTDMSKSNERGVWFVASRLNDLTTERFNAIVKSVPFLHQKPH